MSTSSEGNRGTFIRCRYGISGDFLWVREAWAVTREYDKLPGSKVPKKGRDRICYLADGPKTEWAGRTRSSRFMPRWASRIMLELVRVRVERVQEIIMADCLAEGIAEHTRARGVLATPPADQRWKFIELWNSINAKRGWGWEVNPWVWMIEFKKVTTNGERMNECVEDER